VFPSGTFHKGGVYGKDVNFSKLTVDEQNNSRNSPHASIVKRSERAEVAKQRGTL